jgi:hypothetical protein
MTPENSTAAKDEFNALYGSYARAYERFVENAYKTTTLMLVILGWLLSSEAARRFLHEDRTVLALCVLLIAFAAVSIWATFRRLAALSASLREKLDRLAYVHADSYDQHRIGRSTLVAVIGQNLLLCLLIEVLLLKLF